MPVILVPMMHLNLRIGTPSGNYVYIFGERFPSEELEALWSLVPNYYHVRIDNKPEIDLIRLGITVAHIKLEQINDFELWQNLLGYLERAENECHPLV